MSFVSKKQKIDLRILLYVNNKTDDDVAAATNYTREYVNKVRNGIFPLTTQNIKIIQYIKNLKIKYKKSA